MFIKISSLKDGTYNYQFREPISEANLAEPFYGELKADYRLSKLGNQIVLDGKVSVSVKFVCDRCLTIYDEPIKTNYQMVYILEESPDDLDERKINIQYLPLETDKIYLSDDIRDYSVLAVPMKKLCKEDCKGLCSRCGKNLNDGKCDCNTEEIDERWRPLLELKKKFENN